MAVFVNFGGDALDVENLVVVEEGVEQRGLGPMRGKNRDAEDEGDGGFLEPEKDGGGGVDGAVFFPEKEGEPAGEEDGDEAEDGEEVEFLVFEEKPEAITDGKGEGDREGPHGADVPELGAVDEAGIFAEFAQSQHGNEDVDENVGERILFGLLVIDF